MILRRLHFKGAGTNISEEEGVRKDSEDVQEEGTEAEPETKEPGGWREGDEDEEQGASGAIFSLLQHFGLS